MIAALALALTCHADAQATLDTLQVEAARTYPVFAIKLHLTNEQPGPGADAEIQGTAVSIGGGFCDLPAAHRTAVLAHEIGHKLAQLTYPDYSTAKDENLADYFGAKLLTGEERAALLVHFTTRCEQGSVVYCRLETSWRYAFTH